MPYSAFALHAHWTDLCPCCMQFWGERFMPLRSAKTCLIQPFTGQTCVLAVCSCEDNASSLCAQQEHASCSFCFACTLDKLGSLLYAALGTTLQASVLSNIMPHSAFALHAHWTDLSPCCMQFRGQRFKPLRSATSCLIQLLLCMHTG